MVDRFKIKEGIKQRLAESFETALSLTQGLVEVRSMENNNKTFIFSSQYACIKCGYSIEELEPRIFSFNSPHGACKSCDGIGQRQVFNPDLIIHDTSLSLSEGAICGWTKKNIYYYNLLEALAQHYKFDTKTPFKNLPKKITDILLYGSDDEKIEFKYIFDHGKTINNTHAFEGIIKNIERRYHNTESTTVRDDLSKYITQEKCSKCSGSRLRIEARNVFINKLSISDIVKMSTSEALNILKKIKLTGKRLKIAEKILKEICNRIEFLINVGLNYLTLDRSADTLSGGEAQRIRLASQIGSGLTGVMYILDEPSIGLHQRDNDRLIKTLKHLRDLGNTVIVVEHDEDAIRSADYILDIGPGAGVHGGEVVAKGSIDSILASKDSLTGKYLNGSCSIEIPEKRMESANNKKLILSNCSGNNLKSVNLTIHAGLMTCITGVSGSGKSTLINSTLYPVLAKNLNRATTLQASPYTKITGLEYFDKCIDIDQSPIGRTPRSNPVTYTGIFTVIRELFANTEESRTRGYKPGRFSFNVKGGRCEACQGDGVVKVEMHFLPDIFVACDICKGKRYNRETLEIKYKGKNINQVLSMTVENACEFFNSIPSLNQKLSTLIDVGLSYIKIGQNATTLSGGEAQRIKLARELSKRDTGKTIYILDEPTTGLHFEDIKQLLKVLNRLKSKGNTIIVIEHNLDVIKIADWIIDLGPEGGNKGGQIIATGTPEQIANNKNSYTGVYLKKILTKKL